MKIKDAMTPNAEFIAPTETLRTAASRMAQLNCGFLAVSDSQQSKLEGVITDRDIVVRAVASGMDPEHTQVSEVISRKVLYCFADDNLKSAADSMATQGVYRLIVLDGKDSKPLVGVISLGDILRHNEDKLANRTAKAITDKKAA